MKTPIDVEWTPESVARFWNYQANRPSAETIYFSASRGRWIAARARKYLRKGDRVLDLGCGPGHLLRHLHALDMKLELFGVDQSSDSVARASRLCAGLSPTPTIKHVAGFPSHLPARRFDVVLSVEVVEHLPDHVLREMLTEANRLLTPGGKLIITTPNNENLELQTTCCPNCSTKFHVWQHVRSWTPTSLTDEVSRHGFQILATHETVFQTAAVRAAYWLIDRITGQRKVPHLLAVFTKSSDVT